MVAALLVVVELSELLEVTDDCLLEPSSSLVLDSVVMAVVAAVVGLTKGETVRSLLELAMVELSVLGVAGEEVGVTVLLDCIEVVEVNAAEVEVVGPGE